MSAFRQVYALTSFDTLWRSTRPLSVFAVHIFGLAPRHITPLTSIESVQSRFAVRQGPFGMRLGVAYLGWSDGTFTLHA